MSRPPVPYGANLCGIVDEIHYHWKFLAPLKLQPCDVIERWCRWSTLSCVWILPLSGWKSVVYRETSRVHYRVCEFCHWVDGSLWCTVKHLEYIIVCVNCAIEWMEVCGVQWHASEIFLVIYINDLIIINASRQRQSTSWVGETSCSCLRLSWRHCSGDIAILYQILGSSLALPECSWWVCVLCIHEYGLCVIHV